MAAKSLAKKFRPCGPGGWKCACCAPPPGSLARRLLVRKAKKDAAKQDFLLEKQNAE